VRRPHEEARNRYSLAMPLVRAELVGASPSVVLRFLAWVVGYVRRPRWVWWGGWGEMLLRGHPLECGQRIVQCCVDSA
jgi:hypothetical protein